MIQIKDLSFRYRQDGPNILEHLNLDVEEGEWVVITGSSGCGKSTFALGLAGFLGKIIPGEVSGSILINGKDLLDENSLSISEEVFLVQQNPENQFCTLTVREELAFGLENRKIEPEEIETRISKALKALNAENLIDEQINTLSGGQMQKLAIATAIALKPKVLILDEPSSNLDPTATATLFQTLANLQNQESLTVIVIEHKPWIFKGLAARQLVMHDGRLSEKGKTSIASDFKVFPTANTKIDKSIPVIELNGFSISFAFKQMLKIPSLKIYAGEIISLMGPNGSGKTSLLLSICGLIDFEAEKLKVLGKGISKKEDRSVRINQGVVFQNPDHQLFCDSVKEEIFFAPRNFYEKLIDNKRIQKLIKDFDFDKSLDMHPFHLSYGQKGRLNLASVLSFEPQLLLLDEIFIGQDHGHVLFLLETIKTYVREHSATAIIVNHSAWPVFNYATRMIFLDEKKISIDCPITLACQELENASKTEYLPVFQ